MSLLIDARWAMASCIGSSSSGRSLPVALDAIGRRRTVGRRHRDVAAERHAEQRRQRRLAEMNRQLGIVSDRDRHGRRRNQRLEAAQPLPEFVGGEIVDCIEARSIRHGPHRARSSVRASPCMRRATWHESRSVRPMAGVGGDAGRICPKSSRDHAAALVVTEPKSYRRDASRSAAIRICTADPTTCRPRTPGNSAPTTAGRFRRCRSA